MHAPSIQLTPAQIAASELLDACDTHPASQRALDNLSINMEWAGVQAAAVNGAEAGIAEMEAEDREAEEILFDMENVPDRFAD